MKTIVTAGADVADIDVVACACAYAELLRMEGIDALAVVPGALTASVTPSILSWGVSFVTSYHPDEDDVFVIVDFSDPERLPTFVAFERVGEVYDHRAAHVEYWRERLGDDAHIEMVGACGTLVWEEFERRGFASRIGAVSARLLLASIVSNTLAFHSHEATVRDREAYADLKGVTGFSDAWMSEYYAEQAAELFAGFERLVRADTKIVSTPRGDFAIGQIELWDAREVIAHRVPELESAMAIYGAMPWIVNVVSISEGRSYVYAPDARARDILGEAVDVRFDGDVARMDEILMRKKLMLRLCG